MGHTDTQDPYDTCERGRCNHDLARAVGIAELWSEDGPYSGGVVIVGPNRAAILFDEDEEVYVPDVAAEQQRWAV